MNNEKYKLINYTDALQIIEDKEGVFVKNISFNNASIFLLSDSSYLILPLNAYSGSIIIYSKEFLEKLIALERFPVVDKYGTLYELHKDKIDKLDFYGNQLVSDFKKYLLQNKVELTNHPSDLDEIFKFLKSKKKLKRFKLEFTVLLAKNLLQHYDSSLRIGLLKDKQALNPVISVVLVKQQEDGIYFFNLEERVLGKFGYFNLESLLSSISRFLKKVDLQFYEIDKIFKWPNFQ